MSRLETIGGRLRDRAAMGLAVGATVLAGGELLAHPPSAVAEQTHLEADPALTQFNQSFDRIGDEARLLLKEGVINVYKEPVPAPKGQKQRFWRIVASTPSVGLDTGNSGYTQLITTFKDGTTDPIAIALFVDTDRKRFEWPEPYDQMKILIRDFDQAGDISMQDAYIDPKTGKYQNEYFDKTNDQFYHQTTNGVRTKVGESVVTGQYNSMLKVADITAKFILGNPKKKKTII